MITPSQFAVFVSTANTMIGAVLSGDDVPSVAGEYTTDVPSASTQTIYAWTGMIPKPREWVGPRVTVQPAAQTYTLVNRPYELTVEVDRFHLDDDHMGVYYRTLPDMARQVMRLKDYWCRDLKENTGSFTGSAQFGLDGVTYFNATHPVDVYSSASGTYSNDFVGGVAVPGGQVGGTGANITVGGAFSVTSFQTMVEYMMSIPAEDGEPLGVMPNLCEVPVTLWGESELVLRSTYFAPPAWGTIGGQVGAADNPLRRFGVTPVVNRYLKSGTKFYLHDTTKSVRGQIWQIREAPVFTPRVSENDPVVFDRHAYMWGCWGRVAPGWGPSFLQARSGA